MVSDKIMKRRKRAQIGTLMAIMLILLPLPVGSLVVGNMNDFGVQTKVFLLDGNPNDDIFDASLVKYDNTTSEYTYSKYLSDGTTLLANYSTDMVSVNFGYRNSTSNPYQLVLPLSITDDGKIFTLLQKSTSDPSSSLIFYNGEVEVADRCPSISFVTPVSPQDMLDAGVNTVRVYWDNGQAFNISVAVGVYDLNAVPNLNSGIHRVNVLNYGSGAVDVGNFNIILTSGLVTSVNGSWFDIEIPTNDLLAAATSHGDGYVFVTILDADVGVMNPDAGILFDFEFIGPEKPYSLTSTWNMALIAIGFAGLIGAVLATPFLSLESLSNDGMQGKKYRDGYVGKKYSKAQHSNNRRRSSSKRRRRY